MKLSSLIYYALGFAYMLLAGEIFYMLFKIDDLAPNASIVSLPTIIIVIGLTLTGAGIMLLGEPGEYSLAKLMSISGLILTLIGIGMGLEYAARYQYESKPGLVVLPVYVDPSVTMKIGFRMNLFAGSILLFIAILPAAAFVVTEYERMMNVAIILLNAAMPAISLIGVMLVVPNNVVLGSISATIEFIAMFSLILLDAYRALRTIPAE